MSEQNPNDLVKSICKKCVDCKYLDLNSGGTRLHCNKINEPITEENKNCKEYEKLDVVKTKSKPLENKKHESFCQYYIIDFNGAAAAREAGYSEKTAKVKASQLLTIVNVQERISALLEERNERVVITQDEVLRDLRQVKDRCMQSVPVQVWSPGMQRYVDLTDEDGKTVYKFDAHNAVKALDLLGKHAGIYLKDNNQKPGNVTVFQLPDNGRKKDGE